MAASFFKRILSLRWLVLAVYALLLVPSIYFATKVQTDNSLDRLVVPGNEGKILFDRFRDTFGSDEFILVGFEGKKLFSEAFLSEMDEVERQFQKVPHLAHTRSLISIYRQAHPLFNPYEKDAREAFKTFATSTPFFNYQGFISPDRMLTILLQLKVKDADERRQVVDSVNEILDGFREKKDSPFEMIRVVGQPNLNLEMDRSAQEIGMKFFPIYMIFAFGFLYFLYRSAKGLLAVLVTLAVAEAMTMAMVELSGSVLTLVSSVLPMMVIIVTIETIVHVYSSYVRPPEGVERREHLIHVLSHKWRACWFSVFTTAVGFGSFATSPVLPIRDLGIFVAVALLISFTACFTLFPALLEILKPAPRSKTGSAGLTFFDPLLAAIPTYSFWWRKTLVPVLTILGAIGIWSFFQMEIETNTINYLNKDHQLYKDTRYIEDNVIGLMSMEVMLVGDKGQFSNPESLRKLQDFEEVVAQTPKVQSVLSASTLLRMANYVENNKDVFPRSNFAVSKYTLVLSQQDIWGTFISDDFSILRLSAITKQVDYEIFNRIETNFRDKWAQFQKTNPEFENVKMEITGMAPLTANITRFLLDTLVSSFGTTLLIVFIVFWLVIRRMRYAILAILPSLFAIVFMYMMMTLMNIKLDIGSIMIAAVVLGISVDATIHFFQHFMERQREGANMEDSLQYTLIITGRAIIVSTIVIFAGFVTFSFSSFPPLKHFGLFTSAAMIFSLIGTTLYLPSFMWLLSPGEKPAHLLDGKHKRFSVLPPPPPTPENLHDIGKDE